MIPVGDYVDVLFEFFLTEPLTKEMVRGFYEEIRDKHPMFELNRNLEEMIEYSYDVTEFLSHQHEGCQTSIVYHRSEMETYDIRLMNLDNPMFKGPAPNEILNIDHHQRQLRMKFTPREDEIYVFNVLSDPVVKEDIFPLVSTLVHHTRPFFVMRGTDEEFTMLLQLINKKIIEAPRGIARIEAILSETCAGMDCAYMDKRMVDDIGLGTIQEYARVRASPVTKGYFWEGFRSTPATTGEKSIEEQQMEVDRMNLLFRTRILPRIIKRFHEEYPSAD